MFKRLRGVFSHDLAIDPGTVNTLIYLPGAGIALDQPTIAAVRAPAGKKGKPPTIVAVGAEAERMLSDASNNVTAVRPIQDGMIADLAATERMFQQFIRAVQAGKFIRPRIAVAVPCSATPLERRAIRKAVVRAGARHVHLIESPMAAALGAGLPVTEPCGSMVLNLGGGTTQVAVICVNGIVYSSSVRTGGEHLNEAIGNYLRRQRGVRVDRSRVEQIKQAIGCAWRDSEARTIEIEGRNADNGAPRRLILGSGEILAAIKDALSGIVNLVRTALASVSPELASDLAEQGIVLTGGSALLRDIDRLLAEETGIKVSIAENPRTCAARGGGRALELIDKCGPDIFGVE